MLGEKCPRCNTGAINAKGQTVKDGLLANEFRCDCGDMVKYYEEKQCKVCGRRSCIHKDNDKPFDMKTAVSPNCKHCHGKGTVLAEYLAYPRIKRGRNDACPCGAKHPDGRPKKLKHCHLLDYELMTSPQLFPCGNCIPKAYDKYVKKRILMDCSECGSKGHCKHRPATFWAYRDTYLV